LKKQKERPAIKQVALHKTLGDFVESRGVEPLSKHRDH